MDNRTSLYFLVVSLIASLGLQLASASCEQADVGLADGYILDSQLTASSELNVNTPAKNGRLNYTTGSSWCASTSDSNPYLQIDLQTLHIICAVSTQGTSQADQWVETYTLKSSPDGTMWTDYKENGQVRSFNGNYNQTSTVKHILYSGIVARYLRFVVGVKHGEACLRVEVFGVPRSKGNIALFKPTEQSSTLVVHNQPLRSSNAVDGGKKTHYSYCVHTGKTTTTNPWWRADLGRVEPVAEVRILNRGDCCGTDLDGAEIRVGNLTTNGGATNHLCAGNIQVPQGKEKVFFCKPKALGRYVSISLSGVNKYVMICEVEVYSTYISNLALNQPTSQISTFAGGVASRAVDGKTSTDYFKENGCTHTDYATDPWWRVDLGTSLPVAEVVIINRDCGSCGVYSSAFEIRIGYSIQTGGQSNPGCGGSHSLNSGETKSFYCDPPLVGQYVFIRIPGKQKIITICEVEVYSTRQTGNNVKACSLDPVGISNSSTIPDQRFSASSSRSGSIPSNGRLKGSSAWIPGSNKSSNDYLQIDLGSVYFVCGAATQGNPNADDWTKTYKIATSLDNVNWKTYDEDKIEKNFTGNNDRTSIVRSELYQPLAAKFVRFYPVSFNKNKALRVEVYGSMQGCLSSMASERGLTRKFGMTASSEFDGRHKAGYSRLYSITSWCSSSVSPPQYLEADFRKVITVTGIATQGDNEVDKWVTSYAISYGYDKQTWFHYASGQQLVGNSGKATVVVRWLSTPFAAHYVRIFPKTYKNWMCLRVDLFACKDFQAPFLFVSKLDDVLLPASPGASVTLNCIAKFSPQRSPAYEWRKGGTQLPGTSSSLRITYSSATDINNNYQCARKSISLRDVLCSSTYQCSASLPGLQVKGDTKGNVTVTLKVPGQPAVQVKRSNIKARSTTVTWSYSPGSDEAPIVSFYLHYQNKSFNDNITLSGPLSSKELTHLKPYTSYSVRMMAESVLGKGDWSSPVRFTTSTAVPEGAPYLTNVTGLTSQSIYIEWQKPKPAKINGPLSGYKIYYKEAGAAATVINLPGSSTSYTLVNLKKWTDYIFRIKVINGDFDGPWSSERRVRTKQDAPSAPKNLKLTVKGPTGNSRPQVVVKWMKPNNANGIITMYTLVYSYTLEGKAASHQQNLSNDDFSFQFNVFGGLQYIVRLWAETVKPGPAATDSVLVPTYRPSIPPQGIKSQKIQQTMYNITWQPLPREKRNGEITVYEVKTSAFPKQCTRGAILNLLDNYVNVTRTKHDLVLSDLRPCTDYEVQVRAYNTAGPSEFGILSIPIDTSVSVVPTGLSTSSPQTTSVTLTWNKPAMNDELVEAYQITFNGTKSYFEGFNHSGVIVTSGPVLTYKVENLFPGTTYTFAVRAQSLCGIGEFSNRVVVETIVDYPRSPNVKVVKNITTPSVSTPVTIWETEPINGPISSYQVIVHRVKSWADEIPKRYKQGLLAYEKAREVNQEFYIAAEFSSPSIHPPLTFEIGDGKSYGNYENVALVKPSKYKIYTRAVTSDPKYLPGKEGLVAMVTVMEEKQETPENASQHTSDKPSNIVLVISNIIVGVAFCVSLGMNVYFWRVRRTPQTGEKYSPSALQVDAPQNEKVGAAAAVHPLQETSDYMELTPRQPEHITGSSKYHSLSVKPQKDPKAYENANFQTRPEENGNDGEIYEDI